jgi:hypothetical protein
MGRYTSSDRPLFADECSQRFLLNFLNPGRKYETHAERAMERPLNSFTLRYANSFMYLQIDRIVGDLSDRNLSFSALSVLLRMPEAPVRQGLVLPLLRLAERRIEATLVLLKLATSSIDGAALLTD